MSILGLQAGVPRGCAGFSDCSCRRGAAGVHGRFVLPTHSIATSPSTFQKAPHTEIGTDKERERERGTGIFERDTDSMSNGTVIDNRKKGHVCAAIFDSLIFARYVARLQMGTQAESTPTVKEHRDRQTRQADKWDFVYLQSKQSKPSSL